MANRSAGRPRGRPPKPIHLKVIEGNAGKRRLPVADPKVPPARPRRPSWLTPMARSEWDRVVDYLDELGALTVVDRATIAAYCEAVSRFKSATDDINERGILVPSARGDEDSVTNRSVQIQRDAGRDIAAFSAMFGLSPSDRARLPGTGRSASPGASLEALLE